jgi:Phosphotransferase enzyme family
VTWRSWLHGAVRHPEEPRILLLRSNRAWRLPRVFVRGEFWAAAARTIVTEFERRLGTRPWLLRQFEFEEDEAAQRLEGVFELELLDREWRAPAHGRWVGRSDLERLPLADETHRQLLDRYLAARQSGTVPPERPPWARPGWLDGVRAWLEQEAARFGHRVHAIEQVKHWSISSVLRIETDGPELYFKVSAPLPLFAEEASVTAHLAERFPGYVPAPLAIEPEHGWLLLPAFMELFATRETPLETRREAFRRFAELQRASVELVPELLADGCLDRRLEVLASQLEPLVDDPEAVRQLTPKEVRELRRLLPAFEESCRRLADLGIPPALVHGDLHLGNVTRHDGNLAYFDWTDACIAHPFIDLHSLQWEKDAATREALLDAYLEPWRELAPAAQVLEAAELARVVTPLHHSVSYATIVRALEPDARPELDATHIFLREALARAAERAAG